MKLHTGTFAGNIHKAANAINRLGYAQYLIYMDNDGGYTTCVFKMPDEKVWQLRRESEVHIADPHHDDYKPKTLNEELEKHLENVTNSLADFEQFQSPEMIYELALTTGLGRDFVAQAFADTTTVFQKLVDSLDKS